MHVCLCMHMSMLIHTPIKYPEKVVLYWRLILVPFVQLFLREDLSLFALMVALRNKPGIQMSFQQCVAIFWTVTSGGMA